MSFRNPIIELIQEDPRYSLEAYQFVRDGLTYAQEVLQLGAPQVADEETADEETADEETAGEETADEETAGEDMADEAEQHISGQQLCEAIREYAVEQYGFMAPLVLKRWGITSTSDFGEIVYNLINAKLMKKSKYDERTDFNDVYAFEEAFCNRFDFQTPEEL